jgi:hypothetical protein
VLVAHQVAEAKAAELESFDTVLVKEHQLSPSKRLANKGKQKADDASSPAAQDQSSSDADELAGACASYVVVVQSLWH